ncbi:MAG TPA: response regulator [Chitinophagaceae bacterium]|nr:response regulator [Chitinophagaceae bacterium]
MNHGEKKILIIDDEVDLCILMKNYLVRKDFEVYYAHTLKDGMRLMKDLVPDILFLDNNLPDGTGWNRSDYFVSINPALRLFLMSGYQPSLPDPRNTNYNVIYKPISFSDLEILETSN